MKKKDKDWANGKISRILQTPFAEIMGQDPRDKKAPRKPRIEHLDDAYNYYKGHPLDKKAPMDARQLHLFAEFIAKELERRKNLRK